MTTRRGCVVWLTGLSGSGKTTVALALADLAESCGLASYVLDGDRLRHGLNSDLGFSPEDRQENIRRAGEVSALFADAGLIAIAAFISPYRSGREGARAAARSTRFYEIYLNTPIDVCEQRDVKGLYRRARAGEVAEFTGVSAPYEVPPNPDLTLDTSSGTPAEAARRIFDLLGEVRSS